jgi:predicted Fe-S protein YdhL (DUF1289 family)
MIRNLDGSIGSPCVNWCDMNPTSDYCYGCFRSIEEIASWSNLSEAEKEAVWLALPFRQANGNPND